MARLKPGEVPCPECAEPIQRAAKVCKHCGAQFTQEQIDARPKGAPGCSGGMIAAGAVGLVLLFAIAGVTGESEPKVYTEAEKQAGFHCLSDSSGKHYAFQRSVQGMLRDPDSYEHIETRITPVKDGKHTIFMKFRSRNGFGGMNQSMAVGTVDTKTCEASTPEII